MRPLRSRRLALLSLCAVATALGCDGGGPWLIDPRVLVPGVGATNTDCRIGVCRHNENTDLIAWRGAIYLVHRTAKSQILGPNSSLRIERTEDGGRSWRHQATLAAPLDRDLRDPHFYVVGDQLHIKALTRLPVTSARDSDVDTVAVGWRSGDGARWTSLGAIGPRGWSFWSIDRVSEPDGVGYYTAAYEDGDKSVVLYGSTDGVAWGRGAPIYTVAADTPLETELVFLPDRRLLALVRMDGTDVELLGDVGRLRTKVCWSRPPYDAFTCPQELTGQRLDGPVAFLHRDRLFVIARKHLATGGRKRTALFEVTGHLAGEQIAIREWGELPSAGDTAYAGVAPLGGDRFLVTWYSGEIGLDETWLLGLLDETDIWQATIDLARLK